MTTNNNNNHGGKRKHATSACKACRDSKIRCDAERPTCGNCARKNKECQFGYKDDKRRVSLRTAIDILSDRVAVLTKVLVQHGVSVPTMDLQQEATLQEICDTLDISLAISDHDQASSGPREASNIADSEGNAVPAPASAHASDALQWSDPAPTNPQQGVVGSSFPAPMNILLDDDHIVPALEDMDCPSTSDGQMTEISAADWPWHVFDHSLSILNGPVNFGAFDGDGSVIQTETAPSAAARSSSFVQAENQFNHASSDEEQESDLVQQVSARFGALRIAADGQLRYYGAATNYHLLEGSRHDEEVDIFTTRQEMLDRLEQAGLAQEVPREIEEHLIELYFSWHNPVHVNIDQDTFFTARNHPERRAMHVGYYNDVLINAVCAVGAAYETRYHPTFVTYPRSLAEYFASRAKILLEGDLESPTIATVQSLCLLSGHEAARGRDARSWLYGGMAMRLCFDLGLHIDCTPYLHAGVLTAADVRARQSTFWSCGVINHLSSFQLGRPFRIDSEEITMQKIASPPPHSFRDQNQREGSLPQSSEMMAHSQELGTAMLKEWDYLCDILGPLIRKLYGSSSTPVAALQEVSARVTHQLETWYKQLPPHLQLRTESQTPSEVLMLHMSYHHFQILIHRPWTSRRSQPWTGQGPGFRHARHMCSTSATAISSLIIRYEKDYSLRFMHNYSVNIIFSAALISLFNVIACQARRVTGVMLSEATANLGVFFRGLDDLSQSFDSAKRAREHLATIQRKWYLSGNATGSKRAHLFQHNAAGAKRSRPTESFPAMT